LPATQTQEVRARPQPKPATQLAGFLFVLCVARCLR